jgi:hypothetical protein
MQIEQKLNYLITYAIASSLVLGFFVLSSFERGNKIKNLGEINVERINVVEKDGTVKMIIANRTLFPNGEMVNNHRTGRGKNDVKRPGILFFNDEGVECGGLIYNGATQNGVTKAGLSLTFDQYNQDQVIQILNSEYFKGDQHHTNRGIAISDRPTEVTIAETALRMDSIEQIKDQAVRDQKMQELYEKGHFGTQRLFLGKTPGNSSGLFLADAKGNMKMMIYVDDKGEPKIEFFNDKGEVINSLK